jgi:uncharacterized protein YbjT (DUF2867 family)
MTARKVFLTGGTGYLGQRLIPQLAQRGHEVVALARPGSERKLPAGGRAVVGDALDRATFAAFIPPADTFVQLVGVAHPSPRKAKEFREIDLVSVRESAAAAAGQGVRHFVYVSIARPAPMMKVYQEVRAQGEELIRATGMNATFLRPWYILGPGHWWPYAILPFYWVCQCLPPAREGALRLGLVTLRQMIEALVQAVENPPEGIRAVGVPEIRRARTGGP